jgi:hypothetical protein
VLFDVLDRNQLHADTGDAGRAVGHGLGLSGGVAVATVVDNSDLNHEKFSFPTLNMTMS